MNALSRYLGPLLLGALCATSCAAEKMSDKGEVTLTEAQNSSTVEVRPGALIRVRLESIPGTGYAWEPVDGLAGVLIHEGKDSEQGESKPGASASTEFLVRAGNSGESPLRFVYRRPWETDKSPLKEFKVLVRITKTQ
jgi:predicted secreted protein